MRRRSFDWRRMMSTNTGIYLQSRSSFIVRLGHFFSNDLSSCNNIGRLDSRESISFHGFGKGLCVIEKVVWEHERSKRGGEQTWNIFPKDLDYLRRASEDQSNKTIRLLPGHHITYRWLLRRPSEWDREYRRDQKSAGPIVAFPAFWTCRQM